MEKEKAFAAVMKTANSPDDPFPTTRWSVVLLARSLDDEQRRTALTELCLSYWYPLYVYTRKRGLSEQDTKDFVQHFFMKMLETNFAASADPSKGKLRELFITVAKRLLSDEQDKQRAQKRGGGNLVRVDMDNAEHQLLESNHNGNSPEIVFDTEWARWQLTRACEALEAKYAASGRSQTYSELRQYLPGVQSPAPYAESAERLKRTVGAVKTAVSRLRRDFAKSLHEVISETLGPGERVEDEIRYLIRVIGQNR